MDRNMMPSGHSDRLQDKNDYYRTGFRTMMRIVNIQALVIFALTGVFSFYVNTKVDKDRYFAETTEGRKMRMVSLGLPNLGKTALTGWAAQAASQVMTFGFNDIDRRFSLSKKNFTPKGWESFRKAMQMSGLIDDVIKSQQIVTSVPKSVPVLTREGLQGGKYIWSFDIEMLITFRAGGVQSSRTKTARLVIESMPTSENPNAVGIGEWYIY